MTRGHGRRRDRILEALLAGSPTVDELAGRLGVSPVTVRRDLSALAAEGLVARTYGGATLLSRVEAGFDLRAASAVGEKRRIAERAAGLVAGARSVFLDAGTTVAALAEAMLAARPAAAPRLLVATNSLRLVPRLAEAPQVEVVLLGGRPRPGSEAVYGPFAERTVDLLRFDVAVVGGDAVAPDLGVGDLHADQVALKTRVAARADATLTLAEGAKLARRDVPFWMPLPPGATVVAGGAPPGAEAAYAAAGVRLLVAD